MSQAAATSIDALGRSCKPAYTSIPVNHFGYLSSRQEQGG
jgi:hypothetical protein